MDSRTGISDSTDLSNGTSVCCPTSTETTADIAGGAAPDTAVLRRLSENLDFILNSPDGSFYDAKIAVDDGREIAVHRCILSARSAFFRSVLLAKSKVREKGVVKIEVKELAKDFEVGYEALMAVLRYLYSSSKVKALPKAVCVCVDEECFHVGCRPVVDFMIEVLYLSHVFQIAELVAIYQRHLLEILDKVDSDDLLFILSVAETCRSTCERLLGRCIDLIVKSDVDITTLDKSLPQHIVDLIINTRKEIDITAPGFIDFPDKHVKRIHRALESDDVELVRMLLREGHTTLDDACALHYAVAHCDAKTTTELLELGIADVNRKNLRGYTVLHVAARRKEPKIIVSLLTKGARLSDVTPDGRKALQIAKRLTNSVNFYHCTEQGKSPPKERLCIEILEQAERREPLLGEGAVSLAKAGEDLRIKLLYLENRVALARLLFPMEAKVAMDIANVDGTSEFTLSKNIADARRNAMDLNEAPFILKEEHLQRMKALSTTVELGKRFFPRCSDVLNQIMDADELSQLACAGDDTIEEQQRKKRRYFELQEVLAKAFTEDKEEFDRYTLSSSSSSTPLGKPNGRTRFRR